MQRTTLRRIHRAESWTATVLLVGSVLGSVGPLVLPETAATALARVSGLATVALLITTGAAAATGLRLAGGSKAAAVTRKKRRMPVLAAAIALLMVSSLAIAADMEGPAAGNLLRALQFLAGMVALAALAGNMRDGLSLRPRRPTAKPSASPTTGRHERRTTLS
jgi:hypothetical protein